MLIAGKQSGGGHQGNSCTKVLLQEKENEKLILFSFDYFPSRPFNLQQLFPQNKEIKVNVFVHNIISLGQIKNNVITLKILSVI